MKKEVFVFLLCLGAGLCGASRASAELGPSPLLQRGDLLRGRFVHDHHIRKTQDVFHSEGYFTLVVGKGVLWAIERPVPVTMIVTPSGSAQAIGGMVLMRQQAAQNGATTRILETVSAALSGQREALSRDYTIVESGTKQDWQLVIMPRKNAVNALSFQSLTVKGKKFVESAVLVDAKGGKNALRFTEQKAEPAGALLPDEAALFKEIAKEARR